MENQRKSGKNEMQLKTGRKAWKISKTKISQTVRKPISQTSFAMRKFRKPNSQCENFAMRNFAMPKSISQCQFQFRNAKISQCEISQCQNRFRNANSNFAMRKFRNIKFAMRKFRNAKFRNAKVHFALRNSLLLRNSPCEIFRPCHPL